MKFVKTDLLHQSRTLTTDEDVKKIGPLTVISVIKKDADGDSTNDEADHKSEKFIAEYAASRNINEQLRSCSLALRTAFLNPKFVTMVEVCYFILIIIITLRSMLILMSLLLESWKF